MSSRTSIRLFWLLLALPGVALLAAASDSAADLDHLTAESGEWAARLLILALAITPLVRLLPASAAVQWLLRRRRAIGLAAFGTSLVHFALYVAAMGELRAILTELDAPGIWTGWLALVLLLPLALTSHDAAVRALGATWKRLQRLAYPAALLTLAHWLLVHDGLWVAIAHAAPLALLELSRLFPARFPQRSPA